MTIYKKRDENVDACQFNPGNAFEVEKLRQFLGGLLWKIDGDVIVIDAPRARVTATAGEYLVKDSEDPFELTRVPQAIFEATYVQDQ